MTIKQKTAVWLAALRAVKNEKFGLRVLVAADVASALGLRFTVSDSGFELRRNNPRGNWFPGSLITRIEPEKRA